MAIKDEILEFVKEVEYKIALHNKDIQELEDKGKVNATVYSKTLQEMHELSMIAEAMLVSNMSLYDDNGDQVVNLSTKTDAQQRQFMSDVRVYYELKISPYADLPFIITPYVTGTSAADESGIPSGGLPGWYITRSTDGSLIWEQLLSVIDGGEL
ncbi:MAG: hypothetical protein ACXABY_04530 [Candidatus Thorarchaeota archaeon]|jgi:hypothetical protein